MFARRIIFGVSAGLFGLIAMPVSAGEQVSTWVDADGVRHFSQYPPSNAVDGVVTLELAPTSAPPADADERLATIRALAEDLEAARLARSEARSATTVTDQAAPAPPISEPPPQVIFLRPPLRYPPPLWPEPRRPDRHPGDRPDEPEPGPAREFARGSVR